MEGLSVSHGCSRRCDEMTGALSSTHTWISDPDLPCFDSLLHVDKPPPVAAAFEMVGSRVMEAVPVQVMWSPGRRLYVRYRVRAHGGRLAGRQQAVATIGSIPEGALRVEGPDGGVGVWVVPNDPSLPGLPSAMDRATVQRLLGDLGFPGTVEALRMRSYRPGRRGVVEVVGAGFTAYLKIVRPNQVEALHRRHRRLSPHLPVPDSLGFSTDLGIVVMNALPGTNLRTALKESRTPLPQPSDIAAMIEDLPSPGDGSTSRSAIERLPGVIGVLGRLLPDEADRIHGLSEMIGPETVQPEVPVHGDFHEAQIMVEGETPIGMLDVDTYGLGRPGDDPATMLGHLSVLVESGADPSRVLGLAGTLNRLWDRLRDPIDLRRRTAAVVLGLAIGPFRVQRPKWPDEIRSRIDIAEIWVDSARRVDEKHLMVSSGTSHPHEPVSVA